MESQFSCKQFRIHFYNGLYDMSVVSGNICRDVLRVCNVGFCGIFSEEFSCNVFAVSCDI